MGLSIINHHFHRIFLYKPTIFGLQPTSDKALGVPPWLWEPRHTSCSVDVIRIFPRIDDQVHLAKKYWWDHQVRHFFSEEKCHGGIENHGKTMKYHWLYPLVICYIAIENGHRNSWFTVLKNGDYVEFSMAMLNYQRVRIFVGSLLHHLYLTKWDSWT